MRKEVDNMRWEETSDKLCRNTYKYDNVYEPAFP